MVIEKTTPEGINYLNNSGQKVFLDFNECNENWLAYRKRTESLSDEKVEELREKDRTVGQRDITVNPSFIEFFTRPFTRFEFTNPEQIDDFRHLQKSIQTNGWATFDLS